MEAPFGPCVIFSEESSHEHSVKFVHTQRDMLVINGELSAYIQPSTSSIKMCSSTWQVVHPECEGNITLQADKASLLLTCQHTPVITFNILSPAETCDTLEYDLYEFTCNWRTKSCQVRFANTVSPDITIIGTYLLCMPYIRLTATISMVTSVVPMIYHFPQEPLSEENDDALQQVLRLMHSSPPNTKPSP
jgi:hypothetical protein